VKHLNGDDLEGCIRHLQSIGVNEIAGNAGAHTVANRIHRRILWKFSSRIKDPNANHEKMILDEEADEEADEDSIIEDIVEDISENNGSLEASNASSSCTSLSTPEGCHRGQEDFCQVGVRTEDLMAIDAQQRSHHLTVANGQSNGMFSNLRSLTPSLRISHEYFLGLLYADQGKLVEAEEMYQRALDGYEKAWGPEHTSTLITVNNLGLLYKDQGKLVEAEKMYQRALEGYERLRGPTHPSTKAIRRNLSNLGT